MKMKYKGFIVLGVLLVLSGVFMMVYSEGRYSPHSRRTEVYHPYAETGWYAVGIGLLIVFGVFAAQPPLESEKWATSSS